MKEIQDYVKKRFKESDQAFTGFVWYFNNHIERVAEISEKLAVKYNGSREIVMLAAYLHDIGLITAGNNSHEKKSAEICYALLSKKYSKALIKRVQACVLATNKDHKAKTVEEKIVRTADAMSHLTGAHYFIKAFLAEDFREFYHWAIKKLEADYSKIEFKEEKKQLLPTVELLTALIKKYRSEK